MSTTSLSTHLSELDGWYSAVVQQVVEADVASAQRVAELISTHVVAVEATLRDGHKPRALGAMRSIRGVLTKPGTGSMLTLRRYPELEAEAGRLHAAFIEHLSELAAQVSTQPLDHARLDELLAANRERLLAAVVAQQVHTEARPAQA